ncbi:MAG: TIGR04211 family SH3 domain-containing protein [Gammaproteobacteria bacterium]|jgi:SH3 domain protein|nr:MAG: TIGR04211 family SH3 domain-containing protein [Gammaproteobacteria bacterium]
MKKLTLATLIGCATLGAGFSSVSLAEERYVTDVIYIPLRSDKDNQATILKNGLPTGTRLKLIREEEDSNKNKWSQVITNEGIEGWIRSQNLIAEPTAAMKLAALTSGPTDMVELQKQNISLKNDLASAQASVQSLTAEIEEIRKSPTSDINMEQENQNMHRENQNLQTERDLLRAENDQLKSSDNHKQRIYGGALIFAGVLLSFVLQLFGKRKRRSEWN